MIISGIIKNGVIVPEGNMKLPEGAHVEISIACPEIPPELQPDFAAWQRASDEAWALIDQWETDE